MLSLPLCLVAEASWQKIPKNWKFLDGMGTKNVNFVLFHVCYTPLLWFLIKQVKL